MRACDTTGWAETFTDAPPEYDGFGTHTVESAGLGRTPRGEVRQVLTPLEHVDWQRQRYGSGLYLGCDRRTYEAMKVGRYPLITF